MLFDVKLPSTRIRQDQDPYYVFLDTRWPHKYIMFLLYPRLGAE